MIDRACQLPDRDPYVLSRALEAWCGDHRDLRVMSSGTRREHRALLERVSLSCPYPSHSPLAMGSYYKLFMMNIDSAPLAYHILI